jgi:hypothetical protein
MFKKKTSIDTTMTLRLYKHCSHGDMPPQHHHGGKGKAGEASIVLATTNP